MIEEAIAYAARGFHVFPLQVGTKIPRAGSKGHLDATRDVKTIQRWWKENPNYNIGIATGEISGITVIDVDGPEGIKSSKTIVNVPPTLTIKTPRGYHLYFKFTPAFSTGAGFLPGLDVRNGTIGGQDGGYVVAPPSVFDGKTYTIFKDLPLAELTVVPEEFTKQHRNGATADMPSWVSQGLQGVIESQRNDMGTRLAGYFHSKDVPSDIIFQILTPFANNCTPPLEPGELETIIRSVGKYPSPLNNPPSLYTPPLPSPLPSPGDSHIYRTKSDGVGVNRYTNVTGSVTERDRASGGEGMQEGERYRNVTPNVTGNIRDKNVTDNVTGPATLSNLVQAWVDESNGWFSTDELDRDLGLRLAPDKDNRRQILHRLRERGVLVQHPTENKKFRRIDKNLERLNFKTTLVGPGLDIRWPLGIENLVKLYPGNLVVVAGDGNAGKTAMLLNLVRLNMDRFEMHYFNLEMADEEFRGRLDIFREMDIEDWTFEAWNRHRDFADVIVPGAINIVDFLDLDGEHNLAATRLAEICERVGKGIAVVALQKKEGSKWAKGAEGTADRSRLYLSMSKTRITIVKGKNPADPTVNPNGLSVQFRLQQGAYFIPLGEWEHKVD